MYQKILSFWFEEIAPAQWWKKDDAFDALLVERFTQIHRQASAGEFFKWRNSPKGRLAAIHIAIRYSADNLLLKKLSFYPGRVRVSNVV